MKNRLAAQTARDRKKAKLTELEILVDQLRLEKAQVDARCLAAEKRAAAVESELELSRSTRFIAMPNCPYCEHLHQSQGHPDSVSNNASDWFTDGETPLL